MDAATIEETNRHRVAMGMKPLPTPGGSAQGPASPSDEDEDPSATFEGRQAQGEENFKKFQDAERAKKQREEKAAAVKKARERAQRNAILEGKGLGEAGDEGESDVKAWIKGSKKRQKKLEKERKAQQGKEAADAAAAAARGYTSKDLAGVKVGHDMSSMLDGDEQVLTLKDTTVLENEEEGDELENLSLREQEKLTERLDLKKKRPIYDPNDIDDTGDRSILAQYDDEILGKKKHHFALDAKGSIAESGSILADPDKKDLQNLSLDFLDDVPTSDYLDVSEVKMKKPKKKKKSKSTRQRPADGDDGLFPSGIQAADTSEVPMDIDLGPAPVTKKRKAVDESFVDDDDLQASLAIQRRDALKKRKRTRPEDIARQLREEAASDPDAEKQDDANGGLVIDEVSEFISALKKTSDDEKPRAAKPKAEQAVTAMEDESDDEDTQMGEATDERLEPADAEEWTNTGVDEEKSVGGQGLGAALSILRDRGLIQTTDGRDVELQRKHELFVTEKNRRLALVEEEARRQRERDRDNGLLDKLSTREREEYSRKVNAQRDYQTSKVLNDMFRENYQPNFQLRYIDEHNRELDQKEAFKHLSHIFHGKSSGAGKTSKQLKKIAEEKRREAQPLLDSSQKGMTSATAQQSRKRREAGVRLA